ncbi:Thiamin biosynthesis lipoprotein ApbE [Candidatus Chlamydia sanziniae]|uniref:FAD:protein FMN transferase n=2 Tax=Candidatus Chlamydia sanziniae TaxID=1806891 RepID=A0A1A9HXB4_9CHLA|nr:Thiamin biosynthesis lipoprotein ApbE [Candidatus Chlamydia sanziniae]
MTMTYRIVLGRSLSLEEKQRCEKEIQASFHLIDSIYNNWNPESELSKINRAPADIALPISLELMEFLKKIDEFYRLSEGRFDPTLGPLKTLWLFHLKRQTLPPQETWEKQYEKVGWQRILIDFKEKTLTKLHSEVQLDLCGAIKGHTVDLLLEVCQRFSPNAYVEWGGEIKTSGCHPQGRPWCIASAATTKIIELQDNAIATSGNYIQTWHVHGETYTHILDPRTGKPLDLSTYPIHAVSVIHPSCAYADAMATTLMTFTSKSEAQAWAEKNNLHVYINDTDAS